MASTVFSQLLSPGVYLSELTAGYRVSTIASHSTIYVIGSAANGPGFEPTLVQSATDFTNQFGASLSLNAIKMIFDNDRSARVFFTRAGISPIVTVTIVAADEGDYTLTINGTGVTFSAEAGNDIATIEAGLISAIQASSVADVAEVVNATAVGVFTLRLADPNATLTVTATYTETGAGTNGDITAVTTAAPTRPSAQDYIYAINNAFDIDDGFAQGFLIAPEAFQNLSDAGDRLIVGNAMHALASSDGFDWIALIDGYGNELTTTSVQNDAIRFVAPQGHAWYTAPYLIDANNNEVPPSTAVAAIAGKLFRERGYQYPVGGTKYPIVCKDVKKRFTKAEQDVLNPQGINLIRNLRNRGVVIWGFRTRSSSTFYDKGNVRVIMNVINGSLRQAFDEFVADTADVVTFTRVEQTAAAILRRMWRSGALFGETEQEAFEVVCSRVNNPTDELELGNLLLQVFAAPIPGIEKILIQVFRVPAGQVQDAAQSAEVYSSNS